MATPNYQTDVRAFARDLLGIELQAHQVEALLAHAWCKTILKGRQSGGSVTLLVGALWAAYKWPNHLVLIVSASDRQATELGERMTEIVENAVIARSLTRRTTERLVFSNGSEKEIAEQLRRFADLLHGNVPRARQLLKKLLVDRVVFAPVTLSGGTRTYSFRGELTYGALLREVIYSTRIPDWTTSV